MIYKIVSTITGTMFDVAYFLEGKPVKLSYDGDETYRSTDKVDVEEALDIICRVTGLNGTDWQLELNITKEDDDAFSKDIKKKRRITQNETDLINTSVDLTKK